MLSLRLMVHLYGISEIGLRNDERMIVFENFFDVIRILGKKVSNIILRKIIHWTPWTDRCLRWGSRESIWHWINVYVTRFYTECYQKVIAENMTYCTNRRLGLPKGRGEKGKDDTTKRYWMRIHRLCSIGLFQQENRSSKFQWNRLIFK